MRTAVRALVLVPDTIGLILVTPGSMLQEFKRGGDAGRRGAGPSSVSDAGANDGLRAQALDHARTGLRKRCEVHATLGHFSRATPRPGPE